MKRLMVPALWLLGATAVAAPAADLVKGKQIAETVCAACHAADGNSSIAAYPRLAGQHPAFIYKQTKDIKEGKRTTGSAAAMMPMVQGLSDDDIRNVAAFYAKQPPRSGETNPKPDPKLGAKIFRGGLPEKKIPACMACHSPNGAGIPAAGTAVTAYPRLSGQHADYVVTQLKAYAADQRTGNMMRDIAKRMSEEDMKAVANFIQGLH
ncbi:c-type cytochrome [Conchiformibius steedae]|uniref:Cytochrome c4 n=1 Tax=Conchiformibius steedae TaxID=153493 RepID=A0A3P2A446_9NEIS|nr:c-type cytochrome [Conchiformibius steedae]RRD90222.1 cytochrome c4 [Conchiformibius steedae]